MNTATLRAEMFGGEWKRQKDAFRNWVAANGSSGYPAAPGRYHLYVSLACPWAHRVIIVRRLKRLERVIGMTVVDPMRDDRGWAFRQGADHGLDPVNGFAFLSEAYRASEPDFSARVTVPVLWDGDERRIVSNDDEDMMRMLTREFDAFTDSEVDLYPEALRTEINAVNGVVYPGLNDGVYRAGFATSQEAYDKAVTAVFETLNWLEERLRWQRYLVGERLTEADWRLFVTLIRFDTVYHGHFKCNLRRLVEYPNLWGFVRELYQLEGIAETVSFDHIKRHYYGTHCHINPTGIVPWGPDLALSNPHERDKRR